MDALILNFRFVTPIFLLEFRAEDELITQPEMAFKDLAVFPHRCVADRCANCSIPECKLCKLCLTSQVKSILQEAFREHTRRHLCRRVVPPTLVNRFFIQLNLTIFKIWTVSSYSSLVARRNGNWCEHTRTNGYK